MANAIAFAGSSPISSIMSFSAPSSSPDFAMLTSLLKLFAPTVFSVASAKHLHVSSDSPLSATHSLTNSAFAFPILRRFHFHPRQSMYRRNLLPSIRRRSCSLTFVYAAARRCQRGTFVEHSSSPPPLPGRHTSPRRSVIRQIFFHCRWAPDFTIFRLHRS